MEGFRVFLPMVVEQLVAILLLWQEKVSGTLQCAAGSVCLSLLWGCLGFCGKF